MGTSNFHCKNASHIFAICMPYEDVVFDEYGNETNEMETVYPDDFEYEDTLNEIKRAIEQKAEDAKIGVDNIKPARVSFLRGHDGRIITTLYKTIEIGDVLSCVNITAVVRSGYYEGASLDWEIDYSTDDVNFDDDDELTLDDWLEDTYHSRMSVGLRTMLYKVYAKRMAETKYELIKLVEGVFGQYATNLRRVGTFSNGETIYEYV